MALFMCNGFLCFILEKMIVNNVLPLQANRTLIYCQFRYNLLLPC